MSSSTPNRALPGNRTSFYANPDSPIASTPQRSGPVSRLSLRSVNSVASNVASPQRPQNSLSQFSTASSLSGQVADTPKRISNAIFSPSLQNNPYGGYNNRVEEYALPSSPSAAGASHLSQVSNSQQQQNLYRQQNIYYQQYLLQREMHYKRQADEAQASAQKAQAQAQAQAQAARQNAITPVKTTSVQSPTKAAAVHSPALKKAEEANDYAMAYEEQEAPQPEREVPTRHVFSETDHLLFIKQLPEYKLVVPHPPQALLPPKSPMAPRFNLVLDLDETLVHCSITPLNNPDFTFTIDCDGKEFEVYARVRPFLREFFDAIHGRYEVTLFTASQQVYAEALLRIIDPQGKYIQNKLYRDSCLNLEGNFLKDLNALGRDLRETVLVDNAPYVFGYQVDNGIPIESWYDDPNDDALLHLPKFLEHLRSVPDVRPVIREHFQLKYKLDALNLNDIFGADYDDQDGNN